MMALYRLNYATDSKVIGINDQIKTHGRYDRFGPNSYIRIPIDGPIDFDIQFPVFIMEKKAKKIDLLNCVPLGGNFLVISPKALDLFKKFKLDHYQSFPIKVSHKQEEYSYHAFYLTSGRQREYIDWGKSEFAVVDKRGFYFDIEKGKTIWPELEILKFNSFEEYVIKLRKLRDTGQTVRHRIVKLSDSIHHDFSTFRGPLIGYYCSERFKNAIFENGLTGFDFKPIDDEV